MTDHPLRSVTDRRLGKPLPYQLPNPPRASLQARGLAIPRFNNCLQSEPLHHAVLTTVSGWYSPPEGKLPTCYSPVRHFTRPRRDFHVRLACLRHAASVDSEPGSNSRFNLWYNIILLTGIFSIQMMTLFRVLFSRLPLKTIERLFKGLRRTRLNYLVFKDRIVSMTALFAFCATKRTHIVPVTLYLVKRTAKLFSIYFCS